MSKQYREINSKLERISRKLRRVSDVHHRTCYGNVLFQNVKMGTILN